MLRTVTLKFGAPNAQQTMELDPLRLTVFVGPNNSGKSLVLRELQQLAENGPQTNRKIVEQIQIQFPDPEACRALLGARRVEPTAQQPLAEGNMRLVKTNPTTGQANPFDVNETHLLNRLEEGWKKQQEHDISSPSWVGIYSQFLTLFTIALDGRTRFSLTDQRPAGDLQLPPSNHLVALFKNDAARTRVRSIIHDAFGLHFVIDPTHLGVLRIRMSPRPPADSAEEQAVDHRARAFHANATDIADLSDGVKAFTGLVSAVISADYRIILVDEPEAFLHPPLARKLGSTMASLSTERSASVFVSTHSSHFLMGCIEAGSKFNIVRLTYQAGISAARVLSGHRINELMRDPLLRSTGVLGALFHSGAVICEADKDRAFYEEINARLSAAQKVSVTDGVFLNAQNKQTVRRIVQPLREMGIPAAAVVDIDILKGGDLKDLLHACFVPNALINSITALRGQLEAAFKGKGLEMKVGGLNLLDQENREACRSLIAQVADYGIFIVSIGEVESWLAYLGVSASKQDWLPAIFERLRSDPNEIDYVRPSDGDVWAFVSCIATWVHNPVRLGMPS